MSQEMVKPHYMSDVCEAWLSDYERGHRDGWNDARLNANARQKVIEDKSGYCQMTNEDASNYDKILGLLEMHEEGDPVEAVKLLIHMTGDCKP